MTWRPSRARLSGNEQIIEHALGEVRTFIDELKNGTKKYKTIASLGGQIAEAYRGRCVLELLQNAHDALPEIPGDDPGLITFSLETVPSPVLLIANSGHAFERKDFKGLCQLGQSPKDPNKSVGNKGLGFRSVLEVASGPEVWSTATVTTRPLLFLGRDLAFGLLPCVDQVRGVTGEGDLDCDERVVSLGGGGLQVA